ncbi:MAG: hypothetical protein IH973_08350 [Myxococcales bacterium]|nr:hypothetical protein [Myxococcales bacterium]
MPVSDKLRCASRIAAGLLDALSATGDVAGMGRVRRVYSNDCVNVRAEASWISRRTIDQAFRTLGSDRNFARRVGYALVATERIGFFLFTEGVATIEKAYRRCEPLLAREDREGRFRTLEVGDGRDNVQRLLELDACQRQVEDEVDVRLEDEVVLRLVEQVEKDVAHRSALRGDRHEAV